MDIHERDKHKENGHEDINGHNDHHLSEYHNNNNNSNRHNNNNDDDLHHNPHQTSHSGGSKSRHFTSTSNNAHERKSFSGQSTFPTVSSLNGDLNELLKSDNSNEADNVNVIIRVRPPSSKDSEEAFIQFPGNGQVFIDKGEKTSGNKPRHFSFNVAFESDSSQEDVFDHSGIKRLIDMAIEGFSCTIFAYGQTGSGKTHTLSGPPFTMSKNKAFHPKPHLDGIMQRSFNYLFKHMGSKPSKRNTVIKASYLEIYNEQVIDLLNPGQKKYLTVRWTKSKGFYVENLYLVECVEEDDILAVMEEGLRNRQVSANNMNENSSRSHSILTIHVTTEMKDPEDENTYVSKHGKILFVDLAGSEKITEKSASHSSMNETNKINRSLLTLGKCISGLGDSKKKKVHIPYRDSKLTKLLKDSIGGNGITLMVACISSLKANLSESLNTLYYATQTKKIKNQPHIIMDPREHLILCLKRELKLVKAENQFLKEKMNYPKIQRSASAPQPSKNLAILEKLKSSLNTGELPHDVHVKDVYSLVNDCIADNEALRAENSDLLRTRESLIRDQEIVSRENERLAKKVETFERNSTISPGHSSISNGSLSTLSDFDVGGPVSSPNTSSRPPLHLARPVKPPHRLPSVPDSISKELKKRRMGETDMAKPWNTSRAASRRNSWDNSGHDSKKSQTAKHTRKGTQFGDNSLTRRSESDQHLRKSVESISHSSPGKERLTNTNSLPKLLGYESPLKGHSYKNSGKS